MGHLKENRIAELITRVKELKGNLKTLDTNYEGKRKGALYQRTYSAVTKQLESISTQLNEVGDRYNLICVKGILPKSQEVNGLTINQDREVQMNVTDISPNDAMILARMLYPNVNWMSTEVVALKKMVIPRF